MSQSIDSNFTSVGEGNPIQLIRDDKFSYSISGTFVGTVILEQSTDGGASWVQVGDPFSAPDSSTRTVSYGGSRSGIYRFRCIDYTSGTIETNLSDVDIDLKQVKNNRGETVFEVAEDSVNVYGDLNVTGDVPSDSTKVDKAGDSMTGELAMGANKITGVADPTAAQDAATKNYVDTMGGGMNTDFSNSTAATKDQDMGSNKVVNVAAPTAAGDAANKSYVDSEISSIPSDSSKVDVAGDTMTGVLNMGSNNIDAVADPTTAQQAATKNYVDSEISSIPSDSSKVDVAGDTMTGALDMGANKVTSSAAPTVGNDLTNKTYVDGEVGNKVSKAGDTMTGVLNMGSNTIDAVTDPSTAQQAATKNYVDSEISSIPSDSSKVDVAGDTMTGALAMGANKVTSSAVPTVGDDLTNKTYVDGAISSIPSDSSKVDVAGDTMTGELAMSTNKITGVGDPTAAQDAATKTYVDTADAGKLDLSGGTMTGAIAMGTNKITGAGDPTADQDVATKKYVDDNAGGGIPVYADRTISTSGSILATDYYIFASGNITLTLPTIASTINQTFVIKRTDSNLANLITVDGNGSETIEGSANTILHTLDETLTIQNDGSQWRIVDRKTDTPWTSYTLTGSANTNVSYIGLWKRKGSNVLLQMKMSASGGTPSPAGNYLLDPPPNINLSTISSTSETPGSATIFDGDGTSGRFGWMGTVWWYTPTSEFYVIHTESANNGYVSDTAPFSWSSADRMTLRIEMRTTDWND